MAKCNLNRTRKHDPRKADLSKGSDQPTKCGNRKMSASRGMGEIFESFVIYFVSSKTVKSTNEVVDTHPGVYYSEEPNDG